MILRNVRGVVPTAAGNGDVSNFFLRDMLPPGLVGRGVGVADTGQPPGADVMTAKGI